MHAIGIFAKANAWVLSVDLPSPELGLRMQCEERIEAEVDGDSTKELRTTVAGGCFSEMLSALTAVTGPLVSPESLK